MSDKMRVIGFKNLLNRIVKEYKIDNSIFGIPATDFQTIKSSAEFKIFNGSSSIPIGPAAGPHTQLTQNIIASYLAGGRFFELKTVQVLDELTVEKPCIDAQDECYNVEWSQELRLKESFDEYLKAWYIIHLLKEMLYSGESEGRGFIFNMSVGYNLEGLKTEPMQVFINSLKDASINPKFNEYKTELVDLINSKDFDELLAVKFSGKEISKERLVKAVEEVSPFISNSVTLSTMHGCPSNEIESIAKYLMKEKGLNTYVKLNPTLLGFEMVSDTLKKIGYTNIELNEHSFEVDLKFADAIPMVRALKEFAVEVKVDFGVKLSNTLAVRNKKGIMPGEEMYMSGRSLYPLTINVAARIAEEFKGDISISFSGGGSIHNTSAILECGIYPVTYATDLLKPGGYRRLTQIANKINNEFKGEYNKGLVDVEKLKVLAEESLVSPHYKRETKGVDSIKVKSKLEPFDCFIAPCSSACPIHQDVPEYIKLVEEGRYNEAFEVIVSKNALPNITAHICDHQCMYHCTRWDYDSPVQIRDIKKKASELGYEEYVRMFKDLTKDSLNGIKTAVIGAGPSGLAAAFFLARAGFAVTVFEKKESAGGVVQHIIPDFRLPQSAIDKDIEFIKQLGVEFVFNTESNFSVEELKKSGYKYVYLSIGAEKSNKMQLTEGSEKVIDALEFLEEYNKKSAPVLGKRAAIVGGGNSAMDSARAAKRCAGVEEVYIIYRRTIEQMPADREELDAALEDGVIFKELLLPVSFSNGVLKCQVMELGAPGADKRRSVIAVEGSYVEIEVDSLITAIGENVDESQLIKNAIKITKNKIEVNYFNETSVENVFVGGDALRGPSTVIESIADGKKAAESIICKEAYAISFDKDFSNKFVTDKRIERLNRIKGNVYAKNEAGVSEESRCLECNVVCNKCVDVCPNRANTAVRIMQNKFKNVNQILHIDSMCNECGNCETFCPHQGAPYKDKITYYENVEDYKESKNNGFYIMERNGQLKVTVRFENKEDVVSFSHDGVVAEGFATEEKNYLTMVNMIGSVIKDYGYLLD